MRVLITGVNGFLGRYAAKLLTECGYEVVGLGSDEDCVLPIQSYICGRLGQNGFVKYASERLGKIDMILHLAANLSMSFYDKNIVMGNVEGMQDVLQIAELTKAKGIIRIYIEY